jgi:D-serine deaminase-like pyridoxal phosphate-dependent protein
VVDTIVSSVSQEHGIIVQRAGAASDGGRFEIGDRVRILPNHACATSAMHDRYHVVDSGLQVIDTWRRTNGW